jgi:hypothetical protein
MKTENWCIVNLDERDVRLAAANGGLEVKLTAATAKVIIRVSGRGEDEASQETHHGNVLSHRGIAGEGAKEQAPALPTVR